MHSTDHASLLRDLAGLVPYLCKCGSLTNASSKTHVVQSHERPDYTWCLTSYATLTGAQFGAGARAAELLGLTA